MSFTAEVRDELSRQPPVCEFCDLATLAALARVCGTLSIAGPGRYRLTVATETGAVARTMIGLTHKVLKLKTEFTVRRSVLHKVRNYLISLPDQPGLDKALVLLGVLDRRGGLVGGIPRHVVARPCCRLAYIRGALIAGGFVADPRGDFHLEIAVQGEELAQAIAGLIGEIGIHARVNRRKLSYAVYVKSGDDVRDLLEAVGATRSVRALDDALDPLDALSEHIVSAIAENCPFSVREPDAQRRRRAAPARAHRRGGGARPAGEPAAGARGVLRPAPRAPRPVSARPGRGVRPAALEIGALPPGAPPREAPQPVSHWGRVHLTQRDNGDRFRVNVSHWGRFQLTQRTRQNSFHLPPESIEPVPNDSVSQTNPFPMTHRVK